MAERKLFSLKKAYLPGTLREEKHFAAGQIWSGDRGVLRKSSKASNLCRNLAFQKITLRDGNCVLGGLGRGDVGGWSGCLCIF